MHHSQKAWEDQELYLLGECCWMSTAMGGSGPLRPEAGGKGRQRSSKGRGQRRLDACGGGGDAGVRARCCTISRTHPSYVGWTPQRRAHGPGDVRLHMRAWARSLFPCCSLRPKMCCALARLPLPPGPLA